MMKRGPCDGQLYCSSEWQDRVWPAHQEVCTVTQFGMCTNVWYVSSSTAGAHATVTLSANGRRGLAIARSTHSFIGVASKGVKWCEYFL